MWFILDFCLMLSIYTTLDMNFNKPSLFAYDMHNMAFIQSKHCICQSKIVMHWYINNFVCSSHIYVSHQIINLILKIIHAHAHIYNYRFSNKQFLLQRGLITNTKRAASIIAVSPVETLVLTKWDFHRHCDRNIIDILSNKVDLHVPNSYVWYENMVVTII